MSDPKPASGWTAAVKVILYLLAGAVVLILLVFGTCVLLLRR